MTGTTSRVSTGNVFADEILGGGFPANSINVIMGLPGSGKTIFVEQMIFNQSSQERPTLYLSTLSEPLEKTLAYLQRFSFFDVDKVGTSIFFEDLGAALMKNGIGALVEHVREAVLNRSPRMIVIDSFRAIHDLAPTPIALRTMLYELAGLLSAYDVTAFLVGEYAEEHIRTLPEFAVADGVVQLLREDLSARDERFLRVHKLRGTGYQEGYHAFRIGNAGLEVFPRLVSPEIPRTYDVFPDRVATGVEHLDGMFGGGLWRGSSTLVVGASGSGKTTLGLQFAAQGMRTGEPVLYLNFQENPIQLARSLHNLGVSPEEARAKGLDFVYHSPVELQIDSVINTLFRHVQERKIQRVVIDALGDLAAAANDPKRLRDYLYALTQHFIVKHVTCLLMYESVDALTDTLGARVNYMTDNTLRLDLEIHQRLKRSIAVIKSRGTAHDQTVRAFDITNGGIVIREARPPTAAA